MEEILEMSNKERNRLKILHKLDLGLCKQTEAAQWMGVSSRQAHNIYKAWKDQGDRSLVSKRRGKPSNRCKSLAIKKAVLELMKTRYSGFNPTFASEKLESLNQIKVSPETLRRWMVEAGLHEPRCARKKPHPSRARRPQFGELIQADGSHHHWFGPGCPKANLTVMIDDATSKLVALWFTPTETKQGYIDCLRQMFSTHGLPQSIYTDRSAIACARGGKGTTDFGRICQDLDIELIRAYSPEAKGRVERANRTLQDRLVKELALRGIKTIEEANAYLPAFIEDYNKRFGKEPMDATNAHRPVGAYDLERIFACYKTRKMLSDGTFQLNQEIFRIQEPEDRLRLLGRALTVRTLETGIVEAVFEGRIVPIRRTSEETEPPVFTRKQLDTKLDKPGHRMKSSWCGYRHSLSPTNPQILGR